MERSKFRLYRVQVGCSIGATSIFLPVQTQLLCLCIFYSCHFRRMPLSPRPDGLPDSATMTTTSWPPMLTNVWTGGQCDRMFNLGGLPHVPLLKSCGSKWYNFLSFSLKYYIADFLYNGMSTYLPSLQQFNARVVHLWQAQAIHRRH